MLCARMIDSDQRFNKSCSHVFFEGTAEKLDADMRQDPAQFRAILDWAYAGRPRRGVWKIMGCYDEESMLTTSLQSLFQGSCSNLFQTTGVEGCEGLLAKKQKAPRPLAGQRQSTSGWKIIDFWSQDEAHLIHYLEKLQKLFQLHTYERTGHYFCKLSRGIILLLQDVFYPLNYQAS